MPPIIVVITSRVGAFEGFKNPGAHILQVLLILGWLKLAIILISTKALSARFLVSHFFGCHDLSSSILKDILKYC